MKINVLFSFNFQTAKILWLISQAAIYGFLYALHRKDAQVSRCTVKMHKFQGAP